MRSYTDSPPIIPLALVTLILVLLLGPLLGLVGSASGTSLPKPAPPPTAGSSGVGRVPGTDLASAPTPATEETRSHIATTDPAPPILLEPNPPDDDHAKGGTADADAATPERRGTLAVGWQPPSTASIPGHGRCSTPCELAALPVGSYQVTIHHPERGSTQRSVTIREAQVTRIEGSFPPPGTLSVNCSPWCEVWVDGELRGPAPLVLTLAAGRHEVVLRRDVGAEPEEKRRSVTVEPERTTQIMERFP